MLKLRWPSGQAYSRIPEDSSLTGTTRKSGVSRHPLLWTVLLSALMFISFVLGRISTDFGTTVDLSTKHSNQEDPSSLIDCTSILSQRTSSLRANAKFHREYLHGQSYFCSKASMDRQANCVTQIYSIHEASPLRVQSYLWRRLDRLRHSMERVPATPRGLLRPSHNLASASHILSISLHALSGE